MGDSSHASKSLNAITSRHLFDKVISREVQGEQKRIEYLSVDSSVALVLDDRFDVWENHLENLLLVPPYFGNPDDTYLEFLGPVLRSLKRELDANVQNGSEVDIRKVLANKRKPVLKGCVIAFSGHLPVGVDPSTFAIWKLVEMFGAKCVPSVTAECTHLVAKEVGTSKVEQARRLPNVRIVGMNWLLDSIRYFEPMKEQPYILVENLRPEDLVKETSTQQTKRKQEILVSSSNSTLKRRTIVVTTTSVVPLKNPSTISTELNGPPPKETMNNSKSEETHTEETPHHSDMEEVHDDIFAAELEKSFMDSDDSESIHE